MNWIKRGVLWGGLIVVCVVAARLRYGVLESESRRQVIGQDFRAPRPTAAVSLPEKSKLRIYEIQIGESQVRGLEQSAYSNETQPITFFTNGEGYEKARIRYRGAWARGWPKKPLKIFFDKSDLFEGNRTINLNSAWRDPAFIREPLAYCIYARCGAVASTSRVVRVTMNNRFRGLYVEVEQPEKGLLERYGLGGAALYKANSQSNWADERDLGSEEQYARHYEKQTEKKGGHGDLREFCHELATTTNVTEFFNKRVDLEKYINYLAATALVQNWDGYNKNHYLAHDLKGSGKWFMLPWDLDRTLGDHWNESFDESSLSILMGTQALPGITGWNRLQDRFFSSAELRRRFADRLEQLLQSEFTPDKLFPVIDGMASTIKEEVEADYRVWPRYRADFKGGISQLKRFIERRHVFVAEEVRQLRRELQ